MKYLSPLYPTETISIFHQLSRESVAAMYKTPSRNGASSTGGPFTPRKKGLFEDGQWLCDCTPRKPALYLRVKKEGPNKGKYFYTCDKRKCDFFLFETDAQVREREALVNHNCRSENGITTRVQAKGEPPVTPSFGLTTTTGAGTGTMMAPRSAPAMQQRIFRGLPRRNSLSQDSDYLSYDSDEERHSAVSGVSGVSGMSGGHLAYDGTPSPSQTLRQSSGSKSSGPPVAAAAAAAVGRMPDFSLQPQTPSAATKRKRGVFLDDSDEEFGGGDFGDSDTERQLAAVTDESSRKQKMFQTPSARRIVDPGPSNNGGSIPTPVTRNSLLIAEEGRERTAKRLRFAAPEAVPEAGEADLIRTRQFMSDANTPTPYRKTNALLFGGDDDDCPDPTTPTTARATSLFKTPSSSSSSASTDCPKIADDVMALLGGQPISDTTRLNVRLLLERHEMRVKGIVKGRDAARAALQSRDERVAELQAKVVSLENARRLDRAQLREFSEGLVRLSQQEQ